MNTVTERRPTLDIYEADHEMFRQSFRSFVEDHMAPHYDEWERAGIMPREIYAEAGSHGFLGFAIPEEYGGGGTDDFRFNCVVAEVLAGAGASGGALGLTLHNDVTIPYFVACSDVEQRRRWLPGIASGELITAIAMTEPGTGSDLASIATTARRDGDDYIVNGSKTFITNGINSDLVIVVCRTSPDGGRGAHTLLVVERGMPGFERGRNLDKVGQHSADTAELFFSDVRVPSENVLGEPGMGLAYLERNLAQERMSIAMMGLAVADVVLADTISYVKQREAFGVPVASFQNTKFELAEMHTAIEVTKPFVGRAIERLNARQLSAYEAAMAKLHSTELQNDVTDRCLQLHGGYGYTTEYPIGRAWTDARISRIYGGTSEIMKTIIARAVLS